MFKKSKKHVHQHTLKFDWLNFKWLNMSEIYNFSSPSLQMQNTKGDDYIGTIAFEMKLLMNDEQQCKRRCIDNDGCRLVAVGDWVTQVTHLELY